MEAFKKIDPKELRFEVFIEKLNKRYPVRGINWDEKGRFYQLLILHSTGRVEVFFNCDSGFKLYQRTQKTGGK